MGTIYASLLADLFVCSCEGQSLASVPRIGNMRLAMSSLLQVY